MSKSRKPATAKTMTALDLYEAAFDSACDDATDTVDYIVQYADGAFDLFITGAEAKKILDCRRQYLAAVDQDGQGGHHYHHLIRVPLEEIQL